MNMFSDHVPRDARTTVVAARCTENKTNYGKDDYSVGFNSITIGVFLPLKR